MNTPIHVALSDLSIDEVVNVRKTGRGSEPAYVGSIRAKGLIEPLTVRRDAAWDGRFKVVNGGKRLAALQWMEEHQDEAAGIAVTSTYPVLVIVRDESDAEARDTSLMTNIIRTGMHPVDEFEAFAELQAGGMAIAEISARYALEEKVVKQRLALGNLAPAVREAWRDGDIDADAAKAFTLQPDLNEQEKLFKRIKKAGRLYAHIIRREIQGEQHDVGRFLTFVGAGAYTKAGGKMVEDLFGGEPVISDPALLTKLVSEKLQAKIDSLKSEGWSWAELADDIPNRWSLERIPGNKKSFTLTDKARSGCAVSCSYEGKMEVVYGLLSPAASRKDKTAAARKQREEDGQPVDTMPKALAHRLSITLTNAAAAAMASGDPHIALAALIATFGDGVYSDAPVKLRNDAKRFHLDGDRPPVRLSYDPDETEGEEDDDASEGAIALPGKDTFTHLFEAALKLTIEEQLAQVARIVGRALDFQRMDGGSALHADPNIAAVCDALDPDAMENAFYQFFDPADYFSGVSGAMRAKAAVEAVQSDEAVKVAKMKKAEAVAWCVANIPSTGWLPPELRTVHYDGPGAKVAAPAAEAEPAKKPRKKKAA